MSDLKMPEINRVTIAGRLTRDPELKFLQSGMAVCNFAIAADRRWSKDGEQKKDTVFVDCKCWRKLAEYVGGSLTKGRPVMVEGSLLCESWETREGQKRQKLIVNAISVQALDWPAETPAKQGGYPAHGYTDAPTQTAPKEQPIPEDDIPF